VKESSLAGEPIVAKLPCAPGNDAPIGGLKVVAASGSFCPPLRHGKHYKILTESFRDQVHLNAILAEAEEIVNNALHSSKGRA
jgi:phosphoglucomutase